MRANGSKVIAALAATLIASCLGACNLTNPSPQQPVTPTPSQPAANPPAAAYVPVGPLPPNPTPESALMRNGQPVGAPDPDMPNDPSVRVLHGYFWQARQLFDQLVAGGRLVQQSTNGPITTIRYRLPDGAELVYVQFNRTQGSMTTALAEIFLNDASVPISRLRFMVPGGRPECRITTGGVSGRAANQACVMDGGGDM
ncbi:MAG: hypothetical protein JO326_04450 [Acetobacteraceae bacterium]|nr:hypothetical protein [Acetobacteraceae bacterium]